MADTFSTHCYLMPLYDHSEVDPSIQASGNSIQIFDQGKAPRVEFAYDTIFNNQHEFIKSSFSKVVAPMIKQAINGESTMVIFGGLQSLKMNEFLLSHTVMQGLISQAAGHLLNSVNDGDQKVGSVTFSWFKVDCASQEVLTDVLKTASTSTAATNKGDGLVLRELGKGRGMVVPGLWEVEVAGGGDIEAVINHLQKIVPEAADHSSGTGHTIMQLTVTNHKKAAAAKPVVEAKQHSALGTVADGPGVGRITFVLLSNMSPPPAKAGSSRSSTPTPAKTAFYPWVELARVVVQWLENKRASTPFHKSRLMLLLKDVLLRRQKAALLLMLQPSVDQHQANLDWLKLVSQLSSDHTSGVALDTVATPYDTRKTSLGAEQGIASRSSANLSSNPSFNPSNNPAAKQRSATPTSRSGEFSGSSSPVFPSAATRSATPNQPVRASTTANTGNGNGNQGSLSNANAGNNYLSTPAAGTLSRRGSLASNTNTNTPGTGLSKPVAVERRGSFMRMGTANIHSSVHEFTAEDAEFDEANQISETEKALQVALEASQSEAAALKLAYQYSSDKYAELKSTYDDLLEQLKEEGAFLVKRDRERFRAALKDLKDYEIYKEVMEAAMVRMQQELEVYAEENASIKSSKATEDQKLKKHREFNDKYSKDLVATKKKLGDAQLRIAALEKQVKQSNKEREVAVAVLAQFKSSGAQLEGQSRMEGQLKQQEVDELHKRLRRMEERCRALEMDKEAILASNDKEISSARAAHSKAMELMMSYQEENDLLRAAVHDIAESKGQDGPQQKAAARHVTGSTSTSAGIGAGTHSNTANSHSTSTPLSPMPPPPPFQTETETDSVRSASLSNGRSME